MKNYFIFIFLFISTTVLISKEIPKSLNGFNLGDTREQIRINASNIRANDRDPLSNNLLTFEGGVFAQFSPELWMMDFYEGKCFEIYVCLGPIGDDFNSIKQSLTGKYGKPSTYKEDGNKGFKWSITDQDKITYDIVLLNNIEKEKIYLRYTNRTLEKAKEKQEQVEASKKF